MWKTESLFTDLKILLIITITSALPMAFDLEGVVVEKAADLLFLPALPILESYFFINNSPQSDKQ